MRKKEFDDYTVHKHKEFVFNLENTKFTHVLDIISETESKTPKPSSKLHSHPYYELYYVIDDDFYMNIEDNINIFHKDDIICVSPFVNDPSSVDLRQFISDLASKMKNIDNIIGMYLEEELKDDKDIDIDERGI